MNEKFRFPEPPEGKKSKEQAWVEQLMKDRKDLRAIIDNIDKEIDAEIASAKPNEKEIDKLKARRQEIIQEITNLGRPRPQDRTGSKTESD